MFFFRAARIIDEIARHLPELGKILQAIRANPEKTASLYPTSPATSIDYGVIEKLPVLGGLQMVEGTSAGTTSAPGRALRGPHPRRARQRGPRRSDHRRRAWQRSRRDGKLIAAVGVEDLIVVAAGDAVLVMPRSRSQDVRAVVAELELAQRDPFL